MKKFFTLIAVAAMAFAAQAETLTVCDGLYYNNVQPICGVYADTQGSTTQSIYSADMLTAMAGNKITAITFYTLEDYYRANGEQSGDATNVINFENATFELSILEVDQDTFDSEPIAGATAVATLTPAKGDIDVTFVLDQPFEYTGKNLLVQIVCIEGGSWGQTYFIGEGFDEEYLCGYYDIDGESGFTNFLPKATFTYELAGNKTDAPGSQKDNFVYNDDNLYYNAYTITLTETEPSTIYYRIGVMTEGQFVYGEWMEYTAPITVTDEGTYMIEAYAVADGKAESDHIWDGFTVSKLVGVDELMAGKAVAGVRYFNLAGQEMAQPSGLTIQVTTYTDGTTSAVKVVK